jgi:CBS domain-containing protein
MKVKDLHPRLAVTVEKGESLSSASRVLASDDIGVLVVMNSDGPAGMFSERDLARAVADDADLNQAQVGQYMTEAPIAVEEDNAVGDAIAKMNEYGVRHLTVTAEGEVVGVISMRDIFGLMGTNWPEVG